MSEPLLETFRSSDGYVHHYRHWEAEPAPAKATVIALHGIQSHSGWYEHSSHRLAHAGYEVRFLDRRGSGLNADQRGHARSVERLINDVLQLIQEVRRSGKPVVLLGLSWGGKLAATLAARHPELIDALILLYPGLFSRFRATGWDNFRLDLARFGDVLQKRVPIPLQDARLFTRQPEWVQFIEHDPLSLRDVTVSFLLANRELDHESQVCAPRIQTPTWLALSGGDAIIDNDAVRAFFWSLGTRHKELAEYPDTAHTLEFEPDRDHFIDDMLSWLDRQLALK